MPVAVEQVRRMRGGAQSHLMRCDDGGYYVVKFQNNPQGVRVLANELLGTRLAARIGIPVPAAEVVTVGEELIRLTEDLVMQLGRGRAACRPGKQFGSRYPGSPAETAVSDFLPEEQLREVANLEDFCGVFAFDKWTCNTNGRQAIFFRTPVRGPREEVRGVKEDDGAAGSGPPDKGYRAVMIDQGFCFNAGEWNFPDAPLRGLYARHRVYERVTGMASFEKWLARIERVDEAALDEMGREIPPEWYEDDLDALYQLLERLLRRRTMVAELIRAAWKSAAQPFPLWK